MKVLVCGSRTFSDADLLDRTLAQFDRGTGITIISGGARGADSMAEDFAYAHKTQKIIHRAEWDLFGKRAGIIRNQKMIDENPDLVVAFWDGKSSGTADTLKRAKKAKIATLIVYY